MNKLPETIRDRMDIFDNADEKTGSVETFDLAMAPRRAAAVRRELVTTG